MATNSRITEAEDRIRELEDRMVEINESERKKEKITFTNHVCSLVEENGNPLQYSCLENPMDREACWVPTLGSQRVRHD